VNFYDFASATEKLWNTWDCWSRFPTACVLHLGRPGRAGADVRKFERFWWIKRICTLARLTGPGGKRSPLRNNIVPRAVFTARAAGTFRV